MADNKRPDPTTTKAFTDWFGQSAVTDDQGRPLVVYHGTDADFHVFERGQNPAFESRGFYFTPHKQVANNYATGLPPKEVYLSIQNPYRATSYLEIGKMSEARIEELEQQGFDGVVYSPDKPGNWFQEEYVAFRPEQIKSARGNTGTFSPTNPDIRYKRGPINETRRQTHTEAFQRWFGQSQVVDDQGQPRRLYHGTNADFTTFEQGDSVGLHVGTAKAASDRVGPKRYRMEDTEYRTRALTNLNKGGLAPVVMPVWVKAANPIRMQDTGFSSARSVLTNLDLEGHLTRDEVLDIQTDMAEAYTEVIPPGTEETPALKAAYEKQAREVLFQALEAKGYDSIVYSNEVEDRGSDSYILFRPEQLKSASGNVGRFDPLNPDIRFSRNDPRYLFAGRQAESSDLELLEVAKQMANEHRPDSVIFQKTGWYRGVDGRWRFEISDHDATLMIGVPQSVKDDVMTRVDREVTYEPEGRVIKAKYRPESREYLGTAGWTEAEARESMIRNLIKREYPGYKNLEQIKGQFVELGDVLHHPRLFAAYPRLADRTVHFDDSMTPGERGAIDPTSGFISINPNRTEGEILSTLLHEVQHCIQQAEDFATGGSMDSMFTEAVKEGIKDNALQYRDQISNWIADNRHLIDAEQEAGDLMIYGLMFQSAQRLTDYSLRDRPSGVLRLIKSEMGWAYSDKIRENDDLRRRFDELERNWYALPKRHKMAERNTFLANQCQAAAQLITEAIPKAVYQQFEQDTRQLRNMIRALERAADRAREKLTPLRQLERNLQAATAIRNTHHYNGPCDIYRALAGEVEARNTQTRQIMTPEQRRQKPPELTADVPRDEAIVLMSAGGFSMTVELPHRNADEAAPEYLREPVSMAGPISRPEAQYIANSLMQGWAGRPDVEVVNRISELPRPLQEDIWLQGAAHDVRAAFWNDTAYILAPRMPSREALEETLLHEVVAHYGLRRMLEDDLGPTLEQVYTHFGTGVMAESIKATYFQPKAFDESNADHRQLVAEEMMAKLAESADYRELSLWERFDSQTRAGLRDMGYQIRMTSDDVRYLLHGAERVVQTGGLSQPSEFDTRFRRAFHGSPYEFDRFSLEAVGNGEGQQAYGYGLYFAGHRSVAEFYRATVQNDIDVRALADEQGIELPSPQPPILAAIMRLAREDRLSNDDAAKRVQWQSRTARKMSREDIATLLGEVRQRQNGHLYEVSIPDDDQLLNRDAPLSQQPESVKAILREIDFPLTSTDAYAYQASFGVDPFAGGVTNEPTGADLQAAIAKAADQQTFDRQGPIWELLKDDPNRLNYNLSQITSLYLNSLGIPGLRYRDAFSRTDEAEGTDNYVIWDDSVVTIEAINEERRQANQEARFKRAYHGSPHEFDRFSLEAMGSGEGAQAFGWGLYFAGNRNIADWYRTNLVDDLEQEPVFAVDGQPYDYGDDLVLRSALYMAADQGPERAYQDALDTIDSLKANGIPVEPNTYEATEHLRSLVGHSVRLDLGHLYEVNIPDETDLLDWDAPLTEQPPKVLNALLAVANQEFFVAYQLDKAMGDPTYTGQTLYEVLADTKGSPAQASAFLNELGIPGLQYLDRPSRRKGQGNHNYVIWDDNVISIEAVNEQRRQAENARFSRAGKAGSDRTPWPKDFPKVPFAAELGKAGDHPNYEAAKAGDLEAARRLVDDIVTPDALERIRAMLGDRQPIVTPVVAEEASGHNMIPAAYAAKIAKALDLPVEGAIVQSVRAHHTNAGADHRLANHAAFDGPVESGRDYLIVDDTMTMGGTLAGLRGHIEKNGGKVVGASTLTGFGQAGQLALTPKMCNAIEAKHGSELNDYLKEEFGFGIDCLTQGEGGHFRKAVSLDQIRDRIAAAKIDQGPGRVDAITQASDRPSVRYQQPTCGTPMNDTREYEPAMDLLTQAPTDDLRQMLLEERGIDAADLPHDALLDTAYTEGLHRVLNQHYNDLIDISLSRYRQGNDTPEEAARTIEAALQQGAYGYDLQAVEPVLRAAKANAAMQNGARASNEAISTHSPEDRFRQFLHQELAFQQSCLDMAELAPGEDEVNARKRLAHHREEVADLQKHLSMLDAGMTVQEIRQQSQPVKPKPEPNKPTQPVTDLASRIALNNAVSKATGAPGHEDTPSPKGPG